MRAGPSTLIFRALFAGLALCSAGPAAGAGKRSYVFGAAVPESLPAAQPIEMSLEDAVLRALDVNYDVSIQRLSTKISKAEVMRERGAFEPELFGEAGRTSLTETNLAEDTDSGKAGLRTRWITGTEVELSAQYSEVGGSTGGNARAVARLTQPLLKDAGIAPSRAGLLIARRNRDISLNDLRARMIDTVSAVQNQYWDLVAARERLAAEEDSLKLARELADLTLQRATAGMMGQSDTVEAQAAVYAREAGVARAGESLRALEDSLKEALALMEEPANWDARLIPTTSPSLPEAETNFLAALSRALTDRPDYQSELLRLKNADLSLYVAKNRLLPRLDLVAQGERWAGTDAWDSALDAASSDEEIWSVFLSVTLPLGNKAARAERDKARAEREQELLRLKQIELQIIREVRRALDSLATSRKVAEATAKAVDFEQQKLENERTKLELGKSTTDNVVRFIESLNNARLNHVQAVVDCNRSRIRMDQVQGTTLNQYGVNLE